MGRGMFLLGRVAALVCLLDIFVIFCYLILSVAIITGYAWYPEHSRRDPYEIILVLIKHSCLPTVILRRC